MEVELSVTAWDSQLCVFCLFLSSITGFPFDESEFNGTYISYCYWYPPLESGLTPEKSNDPLSKNLWLFNIAKDPLEKNDLSDLYHGIVKRMLQRLQEYNSTMVPARYPNPDPNSDPGFNGGVWGPWE